MALAGEGCGEAWLGSLDLMLTLQVSQERYATPGDPWEVIPFFHAVYHADAVTFGSYSSLAIPPYDELWPAEFAPKEPRALLDSKFSRQFYLEQARAFVWGQQPTIANFYPSQLTERAEEIDYVIRSARTRSRALKYLLNGTMLRPPEFHAPEALIDFSRVSIYAGKRSGATSFQKGCPLALAAAWRAPDGQVAIAIASIAAKTLPIELVLIPRDEPSLLPSPARGRGVGGEGGLMAGSERETDAASERPVERSEFHRLLLDPRDYGISLPATVYRIDHASRQRIGRLTPTNPELQLHLPPRATWVLEFSEE